MTPVPPVSPASPNRPEKNAAPHVSVNERRLRVVNEDPRRLVNEPLGESPYWIRDRGVLCHVEPLTRAHRTQSIVTVCATRFGTILKVEARDLIRDY